MPPPRAGPCARPYQPKRTRSRAARAVGAVVAAPIAAAVALAALRVPGPWRLAAAPPALTFAGPGPAPGAGGARVARAAAESPGAPPVAVGEQAPGDSVYTPPPDVQYDWIYEDEEDIDDQFDRIRKLARFVHAVKGKWAPMGPKPWSPHIFKRITISVQLDPKQGSNKRILNQVIEEMRRISGKHPETTKATTNDATIGLRMGMVNGVKVTITRKLMRDFLARFNTLTLPRVRDFEGMRPSDIDNMGNLRMEIENQEPFKELDEMVEDRAFIHPFTVDIETTCLTHPDALKLFKDYGFPFGEPLPRPPREVKDEEYYKKLSEARRR